MTIEKTKIKNFTWVKITKPSKAEIFKTLKKYKFWDMHLNDCLPPIQRPRVEDADEYLFMILTFPIYKKRAKEIDHMELDFFINKNYIITIQDQTYQPIDDFFKFFSAEKKVVKPAQLVYKILNQCLTDSFPLLNHINLDIEDIEHKLFNGMNKGIIKESLLITRNIVNFRKSIMAHKSVLRKFLKIAPRYFKIDYMNDYYDELVNYTKEIWDSLDNYKDTINALQQSHDSLYQWRLNEIIKTLTIVSIIIFSLTLTAAIFSTELTQGMPLVDSSWNWWKFVGLEAIIAGIILLIFRKKRWI